MGNATGKNEDPALKALRLMLKSRGLELTDAVAEPAWDYVLFLAPWVRGANLFSWEVWGRIEKLARERERILGAGPPLGFYPMIVALKATFHPDSLPPPGGGISAPEEVERPPGLREEHMAWDAPEYPDSMGPIPSPYSASRQEARETEQRFSEELSRPPAYAEVRKGGVTPKLVMLQIELVNSRLGGGHVAVCRSNVCSVPLSCSGNSRWLVGEGLAF